MLPLRLCVTLIVGLLWPCIATAQNDLSSGAAAPRFPNSDRVELLSRAFPAIDQQMRDFANRAHVPGLAYGIVIDGRVAHMGVVGLRDISANAAIDTNTVFRIASMTKSFTAAAILQLRDAGKFSLDDRADRYVPELRSLRLPTTDSRPITIHDLLTHSAGFPEDNPWGDQQLAATEAEFSAMLRGGIPFSNTPGVAYEYSNYGFAILGRIVSNVSGMPYTRYVAERILKPLGMTSTTLEASTVPKERFAHGYRRQDSSWLEEPPLPHGAFGAMGGMLTSVRDLSRWVAFMLDAWPARNEPDSGPLRRSSRREMQQVARYNGASAVRNPTTGAVSLSAGGYGYGLGVRQTCLFSVSVSHSGGLPGFGSLMRWLPEYGVGIVAMGNLTYTPLGAVLEQALTTLAGTGGLVTRVAEPAPILTFRQAQVNRLIGSWSESLADSLAAMNLYLDESKPRRRAALERLVSAAGGSCQPEGSILAENALRGQWRLRCANGDLRVSITLAPTVPAAVQSFSVTPMRKDESLVPAPACR